MTLFYYQNSGNLLDGNLLLMFIRKKVKKQSRYEARELIDSINLELIIYNEQ